MVQLHMPHEERIDYSGFVEFLPVEPNSMAEFFNISRSLYTKPALSLDPSRALFKKSYDSKKMGGNF